MKACKLHALKGAVAPLLASCLCVLQSVLGFQQEKQARLNQLPAVVSLRLHQVEFLEGRRLPHDLSGAVVFSQQQLGRLKQRMQVRLGCTAQACDWFHLRALCQPQCLQLFHQ